MIIGKPLQRTMIRSLVSNNIWDSTRIILWKSANKPITIVVSDLITKPINNSTWISTINSIKQKL